MSWLESHQSLRNHPKTLACVTALKVDRHKFIGHLMCLWWWALDLADLEGELPASTTTAAIAAGADWPVTKADVFVETLLENRFLERVDDRYVLHDWWQYAGRYNAKKEANRERQQRARDRHRNADVTRTSRVTSRQSNAASSREVTPLPTESTEPTYLPTESGGDEEERLDRAMQAFAAFGHVTSGTPDALLYAVKDHGIERVELAIARGRGAAFEKPPGWNYIDSILERWKEQGGPGADRPTKTRRNGVRAGTRAPASDDELARDEEYARANSGAY